MPPPSTPARRIFHITDWAPAHEALYPEADNDSSIDTLPFPTKVGGPSSSAAALASPPIRRSTSSSASQSTAAAKKERSTSMKWRPKSVVIPAVRPVDDLDDRIRDLSLRKSQTAADVEPSDSASPAPSPGFGNWSGCGREQGQEDYGQIQKQGKGKGKGMAMDVGAAFAHKLDQETDQDIHTGTFGKAKGKKVISGMWRRASLQIKTLVHRRTSIATDTFLGENACYGQGHDQGYKDKRQLRSSHVPSRSHHLFNTHFETAFTSASTSGLASPSSATNRAVRAGAAAHASPLSPAASPGGGPSQQQTLSPRSSASQAINARWHRLRTATSTSFRHSRILHGDFSLSSPLHDNFASNGPASGAPISTDELPHSKPRPEGLASESPVTPHNTSARARAAIAAWQHDMFPETFDCARGSAVITQNLKSREIESHTALAQAQYQALLPSSDSVTEGLDNMVTVGTGPIKIDFVNRLPVEMSMQVLANLDAAGLAAASRVSKVWYEVSSMQYIWRESYLREKTDTYATGDLIKPGTGLGVPSIQPGLRWKTAYAATQKLAERWKYGKNRAVWMSGHSDSIYCLQFDEQKIITGSRDKTIRIWDMHTKECKLIIGPPEVINDRSLLYKREDPDAPTHVTNHEADGDDFAYRRSEYIPATVAFETHHKASILCLQYDEQILVTGSSDGTCIIHDLKDGYRPIRRLRHHTAAVLDLCFDEKHIVTCSKDISICVWDRATGKLLKQLRGHSGPVNAVQMRGNTIVSCSGDFRVKLWNIETGKQIREFTGHTKGLACSQFSEDGRFVASAGNDKVIRIWDANTGECLREIKAHDSLVRSLHIDSVSGRLISGSYDTDIKVFDMETGRPRLDFPKWHTSWVLSAKSDYRRIVSTGQDPKILVVDFGAGVPGIELLESPVEGRELVEVPCSNLAGVEEGSFL